jgi:hypothetical protein
MDSRSTDLREQGNSAADCASAVTMRPAALLRFRQRKGWAQRMRAGRRRANARKPTSASDALCMAA